MFIKPIRVKSQTQLRGSEKRKLKAEILKAYPSLVEEDLTKFIPNKADIVMVKAYSHKNDSLQIYMIENEPLFFSIEKEKVVYPSVYFLWHFPSMVHTFTTQPNVIRRLCGGADLMLPGIILQDEEQLTETSYGQFNKGAVVAVNTLDCPYPTGIGKSSLGSVDMFLAGKQGKAVVMLHVFKDYLWKMGSKSLPPELSNIGNDQDDISDDINEDTNNEEIPLEELTIEEDKPHIQISESESMDQLLEHCFVKAWKTSAKKIDLPVLTSNFYKVHMIPSCPDGRTIDVKKSSYKKLTKFLNEMSKRGIIKIKEFPKGVENITDVNFAHEALASFIVDENETTVVAPTEEKGFVPPRIEEVHQVSGTTIQFYRANGLNKGDVLSKEEVRHIVTEYIKKKGLRKPNAVELDPVLHGAIVGPKEGYKEYLQWGEIFSRMLNCMAPAIRIIRENEPPLIQKGKLKPIEISIANRAGNKKVTLIYDLSTFGIDENEFAHQIQIGVATSTSVGPAEHKPQGTTQVLVQGNQVNFVAKLLLDTYRIPKKHIRGLELGIKQKKKK